MDVNSQYPHVIIVRIAPEIMLKSPATRKIFNKLLISNLTQGLKAQAIDYKLVVHIGRIEVHTQDQDKAIYVIAHTFGISSYSPIDQIVTGGLEEHKRAVVELYKDKVAGKSYAVRVKRLGHFKKVTSTDMEREIGGELFQYARKVDLTNPEITIKADIAGKIAYFYSEKIAGPGGFPIGVQGKVVTLISGGFDSVVAAWHLMKRGAQSDFVFCNLAGGAYERMVIEVTKTLCDNWATGTRPKLYCVDFQGVMDDLRNNTRPQWWQIILKRQMYRAGCEIAKWVGADAIVTGEALGQVSSQTLSNLNTIDAAANIPVLRPLIGFDKTQIIDDARMIGTAKMSEKIPEYCALNKKNPATQSGRQTVLEDEDKMDMSILTDAINAATIVDMFNVTDADVAQHSVFVDEIPNGAKIIDCQPESMYDDWHIKGAAHYSIGQLMNNLRDLEKTKPYVLYCPYGTQSAVMAERMQKEGYEAYSFKGGIKQLKRMFPNGAEEDED
jgi:tRNA uracil 4-sulfurtransferase